MYRCHVCGSEKAGETHVNEVFTIDGAPLLVEHIPATVCIHCGEVTMSRDTTEKVRRMVHGESKPVKSIQMDVYAFG